MKIRNFICALVCLVGAAIIAVPARAQNFTAVTASNIQDVQGRPLSSGSICFVGTDPNNLPISFQVGGGGQVVRSGTLGCTAVSNGSIVGALNVPNPRHTMPEGIFYHIFVEQGSRMVLDYPLVQFEGSSFNLDLYAPGTPPPVPWSGGTISGNTDISGDLSVTGNANLNNATCSGTCTGFGAGSGGGGVNAQSGTAYTAVAGDSGKNIPFYNATASTLTLPATSPSSTWFIATQAVGAGGLTIARNGRTIDGGTSNIILLQGQGLFIYSDGTNYWTTRGMGTGAPNYQTVFSNGSPVTQRPAVNLISGPLASVSCIDNSGATRTDCTISGSSGVVQSGLMAEYRINPGENPAALTDYSGNGNTGIGTVGTAPTILSASGGLQCGGAGAAILPSALNSAKTIQIFVGWQPGVGGQYQAAVMGNGGGSVSNSIAIWLGANPGGAGLIQIFTDTVIPTTTSSGAIAGTGLVSATFGTGDLIYVNSTQVGLATQGSSVGKQTTGSYQLCGTAAGSGAASSTYMTGQIYYAVFYNRVLSPAEVAANSAYISTAMQLRTVATGGTVTGSSDEAVITGDSISASYSSSLLGGSWTQWDMAVDSQTCAQMLATGPYGGAPYYHPNAGRNVATVECGTNDIALSGASAATAGQLFSGVNRLRRQDGFKSIAVDMTDRLTYDSQKNAFDANARQTWRTYADRFADEGSAPQIGADGSTGNTVYFVDNVHPTTYAHRNVYDYIIAHAINALYGNHDFSSGNSYSSSASAPTAVTAASESGSTATFTFSSNPFQIGQCLTISGVTPSGYNNLSGDCEVVQTSTSTQITVVLSVSGLGVGTAFGTAVAPQEVDADEYATLGQCTSCTHSLQTCEGRIGQPIYRRIASTSAWTISPWQSSETINGASTFTTPVASSSNYPVVTLTPILTSSSAGGCSWTASIQ